MRQRREDVRNIAMIAGSGLLGAVAAVAGMSLFEAASEARHQERATWEVREVRPGRFRAEEPARIRLRWAAAAPAIHVDGVRINVPIADISLEPEEIERVDVVKAPAAVEQYGKEGENGVIVITTKRPGKKRKGGGGR